MTIKKDKKARMEKKGKVEQEDLMDLKERIDWEDQKEFIVLVVRSQDLKYIHAMCLVAQKYL